MPLVVQNIRKVLKPNGRVLLRDYATGDLAQERLSCKEQQISENFYVRGDGTVSHDLILRWVQAVFMVTGEVPKSVDDLIEVVNHVEEDIDNELDISDTITGLFDNSPSLDEVTEIKLGYLSLTIKGLAKEYQHTCKSTGLMLWESARLMCKVLAENPSIVAGKRVLELGCGSAGVCSMAAAVQSAELVVATDGDTAALDLLRENVVSNLQPGLIDKIIIKRLVWGNTEDINVVRHLSLDQSRCGFDVIIGTDVTYIPDAVAPLFETARALISDTADGEAEPALIICHIQRRVTEDSIIATATRCGFRLVDRLVNGMYSGSGIISSWFSSSSGCMGMSQNATLNIMYFQVRRNL